MTEIREQRKRERAEAREGRRARSGDSGGDSSSLDVKRALATAASAAVAGALAGAAKALIDKRGQETEPDTAEPEADPEREEPDAAAGPDSPEAEAGQEPEQDHQPEQEEMQYEADDPHETRAQRGDDEPEQTQGASNGEVASMIARAKAHVEQVLDSEPESVSGVERSNGNWRVNVEVVQLHRIPESTDVMASFAVVVDDEGDLISLHETRRYRRSQADDDR